MNFMCFLLENWDSVIVVLFACGVVVYLVAKKQYGILEQIALSLVTEAEKKYGAGTGALKLSAVIEWMYTMVPAVVRLFVTAKQLQTIIERVLIDAQERWRKNANMTAYIAKSD